MSEPNDPGPGYFRREVPAWRSGVAQIAKMSKSHNPAGKEGKYHIHCWAPLTPSVNVTKTSRPSFCQEVQMLCCLSIPESGCLNISNV